MSITRVLQPYVCCLGNPVAGNPTQFVMNRAARMSNVDWRFFTSEVATEQFEVAFRGVQALGLDGVAVFDPFQSQILRLLESVTESALSLGRVNCARSDGNSWLGDNTLGAAIMNCIESHRTQGDTDSSIAILGDASLFKVLRLTTSKLRELAFHLQEDVSNPQAPAFANTELPEASSTTGGANSAERESSERLDPSTSAVSFLVLDHLPSTIEMRRLNSLNWSTQANCMLLGTWPEKQLHTFREWLQNRRVNWIESADIAAHQAACDFHFWTGVWPVVEQMKDSFEEYLQW